MAFWFTYKNKSGKWSKPQPCASAQTGRDEAYVRRGNRRGGWATTGEDGLKDLQKFVRRENAKKR